MTCTDANTPLSLAPGEASAGATDEDLQVRDLVAGLGLSFEDRGEHTLLPRPRPAIVCARRQAQPMPH
ncbi:MAG: hypothetical protein ACRDGV_12410, partial [Candidatus Limnocylindria bacterium]